MFALIIFVEKYKAYLGSAPFKLCVDDRALAWMKNYSMDQSYIGRWIVRLDGYQLIIEHRTRDNHQNADSLSKRQNFLSDWKRSRPTKQKLRMNFRSWTKRPTTNCHSPGGLTSPCTPYQDTLSFPWRWLLR